MNLNNTHNSQPNTNRKFTRMNMLDHSYIQSNNTLYTSILVPFALISLCHCHLARETLPVLQSMNFEC